MGQIDQSWSPGGLWTGWGFALFPTGGWSFGTGQQQQTFIVFVRHGKDNARGDHGRQAAAESIDEGDLGE